MWPRLSPEDLNLIQPFQQPLKNPETSVRVVFFDIGSVLIDLDWDTFFARQQEMNPELRPFSVEMMMGRVRENQLMHRWCTGHAGPFNYVQGMLEAAGHAPDKAARLASGTERLSNGVYAPALVKELSSLIVGPARPRVVRLIQHLRRHGYTVGALSNATPWHESDIMRTTSLHELFDVVVFSQDVGAEKPDACIYDSAFHAALKIEESRRTTSASPLTPSNVAFVDDTPVNVRAAHTKGWHASLVCLLKDDILKEAHSLSAAQLASLSTDSRHLLFGDAAAKRVEALFVNLLKVGGG
ncbi:MAG: hypothetical protein RIR26_2281 [Pseudomonadota bacterium]